MDGLYLPPLLYFATTQMILMCWLIIALLVAMLGVMVWGDVDANLKAIAGSIETSDQPSMSV